jgi:hypothetical protein
MLIAAKVMKPLGELNLSLRPEVWGLLDRLESQEASNGVRLGEWGRGPDEQEGFRGRRTAPVRREVSLFHGVEAWQTHQ